MNTVKQFTPNPQHQQAACSAPGETLRRVRLIAATQRALRAFDLACCIHARMQEVAAPEAPHLIEDTERDFQECCRKYIELEAALADMTRLPAYSVFNSLKRSHPCLPARLLVVNLGSNSVSASKRFPRPSRFNPRLYLAIKRQHQRSHPRRRQLLSRRDQPIPYLPTCKAYGFAWPGTSAQEGNADA